MGRTIWLSLIILCSQATFAQHLRFKTTINGLPKSVTQYIPVGYEAIDTCSGDLNRDAFTDLLLVLARKDETTLDIGIERPLLVLLGAPDGSYQMAARNDNVVYDILSGGMMGDPFVGLVIKNGYFSIEHYGGSAWRWEHIITFKYAKEKKYWYLHKESRSSFNVNFMDEDSSLDSQVKRSSKSTKDFGTIRFDQYSNQKEY